MATTTGTILRGVSGAGFVASTSTYPDTNAVSTLLYASSANVMSALATANNGVLITSATGVPSLLAAGTTGQILTATTGSPASWAAPAIVNTSRPAFTATPSATLTDVTGDGTSYTIVWNTIATQYGSNFNTGTGVFTAPVTGFYQFSCAIQLLQLLVGHTTFTASFNTTPLTYFFHAANPYVCAEVANGSYMVSGSVTAYLTAGQLCAVGLTVTGSTKTVDIFTNSYFSGFLVA